MSRCYLHEWKPTSGFTGYEVSECGQVASQDRIIVRKNGVSVRLKGKILSPKILPSGHRIVRLSNRTEILLHRLVLLTFVGPCPEGQEALHADDDPSNNHVGNLRWGTRSENMRDLVANNRHYWASKTHCIHGHEFTEENTFSTPSRPNSRRCRECHRKRG